MTISMQQELEQLQACFGAQLLKTEIRLQNHIVLETKVAKFTEGIVSIYNDISLDARYLTLVAVDDEAQFSLHLLLLLKTPGILLTVKTYLDKSNPVYSALTPHIPAADWQEREIHDLFGIVPQGGNLRPLVLHRDWPRGEHYPMRKDFSELLVPPIKAVPHQFDMPEGAGRHQIAVGPIHAGIIEPGHLRFCVTGEHIHQFDAQLFYTHKGIEKMAEGKPYQEVLALAEHVCGLCAFSHSLAFSQAIESLAGVEIPGRAASIRAVLLEMERLASHFADLSAICSAGGFAFGSARAAYFREIIMNLNHNLSGHRFLRGINRVGGLKQDVSDEKLMLAVEQLTGLSEQFQEWRDLVLNVDSFLDRVEGAGFLTQENARQLGLVGPAARGSGIADDMRRDFPYGVHAYLPVSIQVLEQGDVFARMGVRLAEVAESFAQIKRLISSLNIGPFAIEIVAELPAERSSVGIIESPKGGLIHWLQTGSNNQIYRWHVRSASYMNWRGVVHATMGNNIVPDGPLINKSFNLCYACVDR